MGIGIADRNQLCDTRGKSDDGNVVLVRVVVVVVMIIRIVYFLSETRQTRETRRRNIDAHRRVKCFPLGVIAY